MGTKKVGVSRDGRLLAYVGENRLRALKAQATREGISLTELMRRIVAKYLGEKYTPAKRSRVERKRMVLSVSPKVEAALRKEATRRGVPYNRVMEEKFCAT